MLMRGIAFRSLNRNSDLRSKLLTLGNADASIEFRSLNRNFALKSAFAGKKVVPKKSHVLYLCRCGRDEPRQQN
jgi:hypothetical protein